MRVVIMDTTEADGRQLAAPIEELLPTADVLLFTDSADALRAVTQHRPDIVMTGHDGDRLDGPAFLDAVRDLDGVDPKLVGVVDEPDASMSARYVDAGATMVVSRPLDRTDVRLVLRHRAGGVP